MFWVEGQKLATGEYTLGTGFPPGHLTTELPAATCNFLKMLEINSVVVLSLLNLTNTSNPRIGANYGNWRSHQRVDRDYIECNESGRRARRAHRADPQEWPLARPIRSILCEGACFHVHVPMANRGQSRP